ncbi:MAG TPA: bifunctional DNA primase/polymerase, partial [Sphingomonas sp.]
MSDTLDAALAYAARGWPVFPCSPQDKRPLVAADRDDAGKPIKGTGGLKKATKDPDQVRAWWGKWPKAMIGVAMGGNGLFVLDFDPRTDDATGEEWTLDRLKSELEGQVGVPLPVSLAVRTPSGGVHVYLNQPAGDPIRNRGNLPRHVDVRGEGGYVIVPPSVMQDGRSYRWLRDNAEADVVDAPAALISILQPRKATKSGQPTPKVASGSPPKLRVAGGTDGIDRYIQTALDRECGSIRAAPQGKRQDALNRGAFSVAQLVAAGALPDAVARSAVMAAALANPGNDDARAIEATIDSGWAAGLALP